ncbi:unnamed protein product [Schistosoma rodhaini]|uniref:RING-type domain-containing protein n=1 Tax=Schistosoma rodhaini TaxID=6188 RepID=A0AA85FEY3_9TREM|nr:unnamed protein product [Schistosoma rodhaini]CAH8498063.1 unnamed protein product [Schistosoma rodhaini]
MDISNSIRGVFIRIFLAFLILSVIMKVVKEKLILWLYGQNADSGMSVLTRGYMISDVSTKRLGNSSVITSFQPSSSNMSGDPIRVTVSSIKAVELCVLRDVSLSTFHAILTSDHKNLRDYIVTNATEKHTVKPGIQDISIHVNVHSCPDHTKRDKYSVVIGLVSSTPDSLVEEINITCYIIHVKIREEEHVNTSIMYTYWKTTWNRLLTPQILFDAGDNVNSINETTILPMKTITSYTNNNEISRTWRPCCFICLSSETISNLRVLLPCRHAAICSDCFQSLHKSAMFTINHHLIGLITCPICRTPVNSTLLLPRTNYDEFNNEVNHTTDEDGVTTTNNITEIPL